jgi:hypothetical protein
MVMSTGRVSRTMYTLSVLLLSVPAVWVTTLHPGNSIAAEKVEWSGEGRFRLLVKIDAVDLKKRETDEWPAELKVDFSATLKELKLLRRPDLTSIQVVRYDSQSGRPLRYGKYAYSRSENDRPFRWYDGSIPYEFPEFHRNVSTTKGKIERKPRVRGGYFLYTVGEWNHGRLAWVHTQTGRKQSRYAIYFDLLSDDETPADVPPRGWIGDGLPRCEKVGKTTVGADHCRIDLVDWNQDGLIDILVGESYGHLLWFPNTGTRTTPKFPYAKLIFDAEGLPIDTGMSMAPKVVDWDGDGRTDLLAGAARNRILFYKNIGTDRNRKLVYQGPLELDGQPLELPVAPLAKGSSEIFKLDYYPILETKDWDGDGDADLLAGGYITGRIYLYENTGRNQNGMPKLKFRGPIQADGKPLNVRHWCAAPCLEDFDGDGDLDLVSGCTPMFDSKQPDSKENNFLRYYENVGRRRKPLLQEKQFPKTGTFPRSRLATPRATDWDGDGDLDLVVSSRSNLFLFENTGSRTEPHFIAHQTPLPSRWGSAPLSVDRFMDWNNDGLLDLVSNYTVRLNSGKGSPGEWKQTVSVLPPGEHIAHPSGIGDDWFWPYIDDFDKDGKADVLFGDWSGHVWFHRNLSTRTRKHFDTQGYRLTLDEGSPIKVGPLGKDFNKSFDALQGARTVLTVADFNRDGLKDLVVGDTFGKIRFFRNVGSKAKPAFAGPIDVGDLGIRLLVDAVDWNQDGWMDVIAGAANGRVRVFLNTAASNTSRFATGFDPGLPPLMQPRVLMADLNSDGDRDMFVPSIQGSCFVERTFLDRGYAQAELIAVEKKPE